MHHQAELLKQGRRATGTTQNILAARLNLHNGQFISNIERGLAHIPASMVRKISEQLKIKPKEFIEAHIKDVQDEYGEQVLNS